jgi:hypothetical protein
MSKVAELMYDIEQLYIDGLSAADIAKELDCPKQMVLDALAEMNVKDSMENEFEVPQELSKIVDGWVRLTVAEKQQSEEEVYSPYYGA